jgi:hypothetical protein
MKLSNDELANVQNQETHLWFYGYITYLNDITNEIVERGFVAQWDISRNAFHAQGPKEYAYEKRTSVGQSRPR